MMMKCLEYILCTHASKLVCIDHSWQWCWTWGCCYFCLNGATDTDANYIYVSFFQG